MQNFKEHEKSRKCDITKENKDPPVTKHKNGILQFNG